MLMKHKTYGLLCCLFLCVVMLSPSVKAYASDSNIRSTNVSIRVMCVCEDESKEFTYVLSPETTLYQKIDKTTFTLSCNHAESFGITYTCPGTYRYTITQMVGTDNMVTYDMSEYHVVVYVTDDGSDVLMANVVAYKDGSDEKVDDISFRNVCHGSGQNRLNSDSTIKPSVQPTSTDMKASNVMISQNQSVSNVQTSDTKTMSVYLICMMIDALIIALILIRKRGASDET